MKFGGKLLGIIFGYMFARIPGAIVGLIIGHLFDKSYAKALDQAGGFGSLMRNKNVLKTRALFFHTLFSAMGHIAKASGRITETDIALASALMDRMRLTGDVKKEAQDAYREGKQTDFPIEETVKEFRRFCFGRRELIQVYLEILIQTALANGQLHESAKQILIQVAKQLGFSEAELKDLIRQTDAANRFHRQQENPNANGSKRNGNHKTASNAAANLQAAMQLLGITNSTDSKTAKKAYKKLMSQHHPDKLIAQGLPEQAILLAKEKAQDIQNAWEVVKVAKGW